MSTELMSINISDDLVTKIGEVFSPLFSKIRIFGTVETPLFVVRDVEKVLELGDLHIRHKTDYKEGFHYEIHSIQTTGGVQKTVLFTETGLYKAMFCSSVEIAEEYCRFITVVMKTLRTQGVVTLKGAFDALKNENMRLQGRVQMLDEETDRQQEMVRELEETQMKRANHIALLEARLYRSEGATEVAEAVAKKSDNVEYIRLLERAVMKPVYVHASGISGDEADDPPENETYVLRLSLKSSLSRHHRVAEVMMVNPTKQITQIDADHECTLTDLRELVESSNLKYLRAM